MNNSTPLISVVVPVYNVEHYLDECVESIVSQTYSNLEIILVDDGSSDRSPQMCDEWAKKDSRIIVIHKPNGGVSDARNAGIEAAQGDYIGFIDSDDFVNERMYEVLLSGFSKSNDVAVSSIKVVCYKDGKYIPFLKAWEISECRIIKGADFAAMMVSRESCFAVWNKLFKRSILSNIRFRKGRINEDALFLFELGRVLKKEQTNLVELPFTAYYYRIRPDSFCTSSQGTLFVDTIQNLEVMMSECDETDVVLKRTIFNQYILQTSHFIDKMVLDENRILFPVYYKTYIEKAKKFNIVRVTKELGLIESIKLYLNIYIPSFRLLIKKSSWK